MALYNFLTLKSAAIQFCQHTFFQHIPEHQSLLIETAICSEQDRLCWNESSHLKLLFFHRKIFLRIPSFLEQLLLFNNYFLTTNTFSDRLLLKDKKVSAELLFWRSFFSRMSNYSEHVIFCSRYIFRAVTFSEEDLFYEQVFHEYGHFFW